MNIIKPIFHQLEAANHYILKILEIMEESDLELSLGAEKRTLRELLAHLAVIYKADFMILNGATQQEMEEFYEKHHPQTIAEIKEMLLDHFAFLKEKTACFSNEDWSVVTTSWWGVSYSRYEWMLEILGHVYHHRGQLQTVLAINSRDPKIQLFE
ncbi:DinB family protein [Fictibacillus sp. FJAT-27399]|uniref:DinB family protein n=1 Tax=Fictibacillus sp. FJAT-27399 TaxID=1729689 RepID=UPI00078367FD|nr:DinB family protein [Fictibacillus sp. FJAT-27399]